MKRSTMAAAILTAVSLIFACQSDKPAHTAPVVSVTLPAEAEPPPEPEPEPEPEPAPSAQPAESAACTVKVIELLAAEVFRGPGPITPMQEEMFRKNPRMARRHSAYGHGDHHLRCTFLLSIAGKRYSHEHNIHNTGRVHDASHCKEVIGDIPAHVRKLTKECTDLVGGEYYGFVFKPMPASSSR